MKFATLALMTAAVVLTGCESNSLISLDPFVTAQEAVFDAGLVGTWTDGQGDDPGQCIIRRNGEGAYKVTYVGGDATMQFDAVLFRAGDASVLDSTPAKKDDDFSVAGHVPVRVWIEGSQLRWAYLDSEWLREQASRQLAGRSIEKRMLLVAPAHDFLMKYAADERAHGNITTWQRM